MPIEADQNDYRRGYRKHYQAYKFLSKNNDCSISRRLLLVYCVECGLKYRLLEKWRQNSSKAIQDEKNNNIITHELEDLLKRLGQAGTFRFPKSIKTAHGDAINGRNFHEMCRYGIQCGCNSEDDLSRFVEELEKIAKWLEEGM